MITEIKKDDFHTSEQICKLNQIQNKNVLMQEIIQELRNKRNEI